MSAGTRPTKGDLQPQQVTAGPHVHSLPATETRKVSAGAARYSKAPAARKEYLGRLGSPEHRRRPDDKEIHDYMRPGGGGGRGGRPGGTGGPPAVNIFEDLERVASSDVGSGRRHGAKYYQPGQFGHIAGQADLGSDSRRRDCHFAAPPPSPPSPFSRFFNMD